MKEKARQLIKRGLSGLLALVMILSVFITYVPSISIAAGNKVEIDGGFEEDTWKTISANTRRIVYSQVSKTDEPENVRSGNYAAKFAYDADSAGTGKYVELFNQTFDLEPNTEYEFSFWCQNDGLTLKRGYIGIAAEGAIGNPTKWYAEKGKDPKKDMAYVDKNATSWTEVKKTFTTGEDDTKGTIKMLIELPDDTSSLTDGVAFYLDDIEIKKVKSLSTKKLSGELAVVGETKIDQWSATENGLVGSVQSAIAKKGDALKIASSAENTGASTSFELISEEISVEQSAKYYVSYFVKTPDFPGINYGVTILNAKNDKVIASNIGAGKTDIGFGTSWVECEGNFATETADKIKIKISAYTEDGETLPYDAGAALYIDELLLEKIPASAKNDGTFDGGFEKTYNSVLLNWSARASEALEVSATDNARSGKSAIQFKNINTSTDYQIVSSNRMEVEANTTYDISFYVKNVNLNGGSGYVTVRDDADPVDNDHYLGSIRNLVNFTAREDNAGSWIRYTGRFTTGAKTEKIFLQFTVTSRQIESPVPGSRLYIDDVTVRKHSEDFDGGFESVENKTILNWTARTSAVLDVSATEDAHSGNYAMQFQNINKQTDYQIVTSNRMEVEPNTTYDVSFFVKNVNLNGGSGYVTVRDDADPVDNDHFLGSMRNLVNFVAKEDNAGQWIRYSGSFTTGPKTEKIFLQFTVTSKTIASPVAGSRLYIDDVLVEHHDDDLDGGFEKVTFGVLKNWTYRLDLASEVKKTIQAVPTTKAFSGNYAMKLENTSKELGYQEVVSKTVTLEPNTTYNISYYMKNVDFAGAVGYVAAYDAKTKEWMGARKDLANYSIAKNSSTEWKLYTGQFTTGSNTTDVYFTFNISTRNMTTAAKVGASLYIDDFVVEKDTPEKSLIKNPDFEKVGLLSWRTVIYPQDSDGNLDLNIPHQMQAVKVAGGQHGEHSLYMQADVTGYITVMQDKAFPVKPNSTYRFVYYVKTKDADNATVNVAIRAYKKDGVTTTRGDYARTAVAPSNQTEWKKVVTYINTAEDQYFMNLQLLLATKGGKVAKAWFDNLSIEKVLAIGEKANLGFEYIENESLYDWSFKFGAGSGSDALQADADSFAWEMETKTVHEGKKAIKITTKSPVGYAELDSRALSVESGATYKVTFWLHMSGAISAETHMGFHMTKADGTPASTEWYWASSNRVDGPTNGWQKVTVYLNVADDAKYADMRFITSGRNTTTIIDDVTFEKYNIDDNLNLSFESDDHNWTLGSGNITIDNQVYHGGNKSLHVVKSGQRDTKITSMSYTSVEEGDVFLFGGWYKSKNNINAKVRINLNCYDAEGSMYRENGSRRIVLGPEVNGNTDTEASEWQRLMLYGSVPTGTVKVGLEIIIGDGRAEMWFDDLFLRKANVTEDSRLVDYTMMDEIDNDGVLQSVMLQEVSGTVNLTTNDGTATLQVEDKSEAYLAFETDYMTSEESYDITLHNYIADKDAKILVQYYDYQGRHLEQYDVSETVPASKEWADYTMRVAVPSSMYAKICFGSSKAGNYTLSQIDVVNVKVGDISSTWAGRWIWFNEDALQNGQYAHRYYRHKFTLDGKATYAPLQITVDDWYILYVNGQEVADTSDAGNDSWQVPRTYDLVPFLKEGENIIAIETYNKVNVGGLLYDCRISLDGNDDERIMITSDPTQVISTDAKPGKGWTEYSYNDASWSAVKDMGMVGVGPWGPIAFDSSLYADDKIEIISFETQEEAAHAGSEALIDAVIKVNKEFEHDYPFEVNVYKKNTTNQITSAVLEIVDGKKPSEWQEGENKVTFSLSVPDYLSTGNYSLQMSEQYYYLENEGLIDNIFADITVLAANEKQELHHAEVKSVNGTPTFFVDGEAKSNIMYQDPSAEMWWDMQNEGKVMEQSNTEIYVSNRLTLWSYSGRSDSLWLDENTINYAYVDKVVYDVLSADSDALIMSTITLHTPSWWLDQNPDEEMLLYDSETKEFRAPTEQRQASWSSQKWLTDVNEVLDKIIKHMMESDYASHIIGIRISAGKGPEYLTYEAGGAITSDYSKASLKRFRTWLKETYKTDKALQEAWNEPDITFDKVTVPKWEDRINAWLSTDGVSDTIIMDPAESRWVIDYNYFCSYEATNTFVKCCEQIKESSEGHWLAGGYHGYAWHAAGTGGIAASHEAMDLVLESDAVDFVASPYIYGEKKKGEDSALYAMIDGIQAAGKMYILEIDTRSVYEGTSNADTDASVGVCYTMRESINALKKDMSQMMARGAGFWVYNMYGTWWYDEQMLSVMKDVKREMDYIAEIGSPSNSEVAVFIGEMNYAYLSNAETYSANRTYNYLYQFQRRNLATMGTEFDLYYVQDLLKGRIKKDYKINIMLSPYELTEKERKAVEKELKRDGKIIVWVNLAGISDGSANSLEHMKDLTGFDVQYVQTKGALTGYFTSGHLLTKGIEGFIYGDDATGATNGVGPLLYVDASGDSSITELAKCVFDESKSAMVMKDMGDWISIYSGPACLPNGFLRNLVDYSGGHIYTDNKSDIVHHSENYLSIYSLYGGERTVTLPKACSVYDVYAQEYVSLNTDSFKVTLADNESKTYRLMETDKVAVLAITKGAHASLDKQGVTELSEGDSYEVTVKVDKGYQLKSVKVNGEEVDITETVKLKEVTDSTHIVFETEQIKTYGVYTSSLAVRWGTIGLLILGIVAGFTAIGVAAEIAVESIRRKKRKQ